MLAGSVDPSSGSQRASYEGLLISRGEIDDLVDYFLRGVWRTGLRHACVHPAVRTVAVVDGGGSGVVPKEVWRPKGVCQGDGYRRIETSAMRLSLTVFTAHPTQAPSGSLVR